MTERAALILIACAISAILYFVNAPKPLTFEQRWQPVKFITQFTRGA